MELKFKVEAERSSRIKLFVQGGRKIMLDALSQKLDSTERIYFIDPRSLLLSGIVLGDANSLVQKGNWLGQAVAVKKCGDGFRYCREAGVFQHFQPSHPNVIQVLGESEVPETKEKLLVMEEKNSDLKRYFHSSGPITQLQAVDFLIQIAGAMVYLHGKGVCYRDLKLENIMIDVQYLELTLADFGHSKPRFDPLGDNTCPVGTVSYMAPEVLAGITSGQDPGYGFSVDVFSFGIACSEIVSGQPLELTVPLTREERIERLRRGERPSLPESCHQKLKKLITQCWDFSPKNRPTFEVIYEKLWEIKEELLAGSPASTDPGEAAPASEIQAAGIQNLAITGANTVGSKSTATWQYVNDTSFCVVGWQRYRDLESEEPQLSWKVSLTSGTSSDYTITPDDLDRHVGVICLPLALVDGKIVPRQQARFTHGALVSQDPAMAREMERHLRKEHVAFDITVDRRKIKLNLCHTDYHLVWHMGSTKNFRGQFVRGDVSVEVVGDCSMVISKASQSQRSTIDFKDSYRRNLAVLLIRHFLESSPSQNGLDHIPTRNTW
ncbi:probable LIM domain-containing serine/threonine-protein kinase DDB_G0286997 [Selaginella moellendorffii]|nr:probable LIM domain-containing serine/threonine-protein kinase DDB_G0286997 [Selaginella moellendorffii]|eukprot:XP_024531133.1 probable LIM domain-containing serine/threonine-protein kinase DDB_G0286997 [Selaginella moellendorffii]